MLATIYRQSAVWGFNIGRRGATSAAERAINFLFYNAAPHTFITVDSDLKNFIESYYLMWVPWFKLNHRNVESFRRDGDRTVIGLEGNSHVDLDWANKTYSVTLDGAEIARDGSTFCPLDNERIAFYSADAKELSAPLPRGWESNSIAAIALSADKPQPLELKVEGGQVTVAVPAQRPVIVYREGDKAKKRLLAAG